MNKENSSQHDKVQQADATRQQFKHNSQSKSQKERKATFCNNHQSAQFFGFSATNLPYQITFNNYKLLKQSVHVRGLHRETH